MSLGISKIKNFKNILVYKKKNKETKQRGSWFVSGWAVPEHLKYNRMENIIILTENFLKKKFLQNIVISLATYKHGRQGNQLV